MTRFHPSAVFAPLAVTALLTTGGARAQDPPLALELLVTGLDQPVGVAHAGDGSGRLFIIERRGRILVWQHGALLPAPFLDIRHLVDAAGAEQGLLGLAFHPRFAENGLFFVHYTRPGTPDQTVVARYRVSADPDRADPASGLEVLSVDQPFANHNGGDLRFGPDGYLYVALGDGGGAGDPLGTAQDPGSLLGKLLRLDVDAGAPYAIPADNPFVGAPGRDEIWSLGLRNPWRFSFDRATGDLFLGDVGQNAVEEVDLQPAGQGGLNFGWSCFEGSQPFAPGGHCPAGLVAPILEYGHGEGCAVTGGFRYRGGSGALWGDYFFGDFCSGRIWHAHPIGDTWVAELWLDTALSVSSFGEDEVGELLVVDFGGAIYRLAAPGGAPLPPAGAWFESPELPGFQIKVRLSAGEHQPEVRLEPSCIPETLCVSGALPGRTEVQVRVVGPRPNGRLWPILVRLTTSRVEVWIRQVASGILRYYELPAASPGDDSLDGSFDRYGFPP
ncbi:MAG TPA: PQQ-dependent sugar dehydrogenase [Thermoanaerobaculia bacterium]|nr:PQQ-dependent sugar dehydrogenase [Thermoanaerobaculia bacterium]